MSGTPAQAHTRMEGWRGGRREEGESPGPPPSPGPAGPGSTTGPWSPLGPGPLPGPASDSNGVYLPNRSWGTCRPLWDRAA